MDPTLYGILCLLSALLWALFIFWPDQGFGRYSKFRLRMRRFVLACWRYQIALIRRVLG